MAIISNVAAKAALFFLAFSTAHGDNASRIRKGESNRGLVQLDLTARAGSCPSSNSCRRFLEGRLIHQMDGTECNDKCSLRHKRALKRGWKCGPCPDGTAPAPVAAPVKTPAPVRAPVATVISPPVPVAVPVAVPVPVVAPMESPVVVAPIVAPLVVPVVVPVVAPVTAPFKATTNAPFKATTNAPFKATTNAPFKAATNAPFKATTNAPFKATTNAPFKATTNAPFKATTNAPFKAATKVPTLAPKTSAPTMQPATGIPTSMPTFAPTVEPLFDIVINEYSTGDGVHVLSWIELVNNGPAAVNLKGFKVTTSKSSWVIQSNLYIKSRGYAVLKGSQNAKLAESLVALSDNDYVLDGLVLQNVTDYIDLYKRTGELHDDVTWDAGDNVVDAHAVARFDSTDDNDDDPWWCEATNQYTAMRHGTPGEYNDCIPFSNTIKITEIMSDPNGNVARENLAWFEVQNTGYYPVNLRNWRPSSGLTKWTITEELVLDVGEYLVFGDKGAVRNVANYYVLPGFRLDAEDTGTVMLLSPEKYGEEDMVHNQVEWNNPPYDGWSMTQGASVALRSSGLANYDPDNWCTSSNLYSDVNRGTPGRENDCIIEPETIVINEIMVDYVTRKKFDKDTPEDNDDTSLSWIELYNQGAYDVNLRGWGIVVEGVTIPFLFDLVVPTNGFLVLSNQPNTMDTYGFDSLYLLIGVEMVRSGDVVRLVTPQKIGRERVRHDSVVWNEEWTDMQKANSALALKKPKSKNQVADSWCASFITDFNVPGTPGTPNDCAILVINEVMFTGVEGGDWIELYNAGSYPVSLDGWTVKYGIASTFTISEPVTIGIGEYRVIGNFNQADIADPNFALYAGNGLVQLFAPGEGLKPIDSVTWNIGWASWTPTGTQSMALRSPDMDKEQEESWCKSLWTYDTFTNEQGTPGDPNDCPQAILTEIMLDPLYRDTSAQEWVELYNPSDYALDLKNWQVVVDHTAPPIVISNNIVIGAGAYKVISTANIPELKFDNREGVMAFISPDGFYSFGVAWDAENNSGWTQTPGSSMALKSLDKDPVLSSSWCRSSFWFDGSGNKGTPGRRNDCFAKYENGF